MLICPKCGKKDTDVQFLESFCTGCYPFNIRVPKPQGIELCKKCGKMRLLGEWQEFSRKRIAEWMAGRLRGDFSSVKYDIEHGIATVTVTKQGRSAVIERRMPLATVNGICPECSKMAGGYFEAIIQLRGNRSKVDKHRRLFEKMLSGKTFIGKNKEMHGGIDLYVGSSRAVFGLLAELGLHAKISRKLFGGRNGRRIYRTSFSVRFE